MIQRVNMLKTNASGDKSLEREARIFVSSPFPMVLMRMKGCEEVCANPAHEQQFHDGLSIARSEAEFRKFYRVGVPDDGKRRSHACYCEKMGSLIAIRSGHCAFEWSFDQLLSVESPTSRLDFLDYQINGHRSYNVVNTHSHLLSYSLSDGSGFMLSTLVRAGSMRVQLHSQGFRPTQMGFALQVDDLVSPRPETVPVPQDDAYWKMDECMMRAMDRIAEGKPPADVCQRMEEEVRTFQEMDYAAVATFVAGLFDPKDKKGILQRIQRERTRLFDAPMILDMKLGVVTEKLHDFGLIGDAAREVDEIARIKLDESRKVEQGTSAEPHERAAAGAFVPSHPADTRPGKLRREIEVFEQMQPQWAGEHADKFVAVHEGKVIDSDRDEWILIDRVFRKMPDTEVLIRHVEEKKQRAARV